MAADANWTAQWDQAKWAVNEYNRTHQDKRLTLRKVLDTSTAVVCVNAMKHIFKEKFLVLVDTTGNPTSQLTCLATVSQTCDNMKVGKEAVGKELESFNIINN